MGLPKAAAPLCSVDDYLKLERKALDRHYFLDGEVYAMAGESWEHGGIALNIGMVLGLQLRNKPCQVRTQNTRVRSGPTPRGAHRFSGLYSYPDVVVVCDEPEFHDSHRDVVLNPRVVFEVLSPSTESFDRGEKFTRYQINNPTLTDYIFVSQHKPQIEHFLKKGGKWSYEIHTSLKETITVASIGCRLKMRDVYSRIDLTNTSKRRKPQ